VFSAFFGKIGVGVTFKHPLYNVVMPPPTGQTKHGLVMLDVIEQLR